MELGERTGYLVLSAKVNVLTDRIRKATHARDRYQVAALRLERASLELELRDLFGARTTQGERWEMWMEDDLKQAGKLADQLAEKVGDHKLLDRLLSPFPTLQRLAS